MTIFKAIYYFTVILGVITSTTIQIPTDSEMPPQMQIHPETTIKSPPTIERNNDSLKFIGPHNIHDHYFQLRSLQKSSHLSIVDSIKSTYNIIPIMRDLNVAMLNDQEIFDALIKREIAWNYSDLNEFGLMRCEDLKFRFAHFAKYIELIPEGRRISIENYDKQSDYQVASQAVKDLQTKCLIKGLEKTGSPNSTNPINCQTGIPFCFSDSWKQIWWKHGE